jgi:hypothetical protein
MAVSLFRFIRLTRIICLHPENKKSPLRQTAALGMMPDAEFSEFVRIFFVRFQKPF